MLDYTSVTPLLSGFGAHMPVGPPRPGRRRSEWSSASLVDSPPRKEFAKTPPERRFAPPSQTPGLRFAELSKSADAAETAGDHRTSLRCLLKCLALAKVRVASIVCAGGVLGRDEACAVAKTHVRIAEVYEKSKGLGLGFGDANGATNDDDVAASQEASEKNGLAQAVTHLQHAIGACGLGFIRDTKNSSNTRLQTTSKNNGNGSVAQKNISETATPAVRLALAQTKLDARAKLAPRLLAVGRVEDACECTKRALDSLGSDTSDTTVSTSATTVSKNPQQLDTKLALLLCSADAERLAGVFFQRKARAARIRARRAKASLRSGSYDSGVDWNVGVLDTTETRTHATTESYNATEDLSGEAFYLRHSKLAWETFETVQAFETAQLEHEDAARSRFATCDTRLHDAEKVLSELSALRGNGSIGTPSSSPNRTTIVEVYTRRRDLRRSQGDWKGAVVSVTQLLHMAVANHGALPGTNATRSHGHNAFATGALHGELAELFIRRKDFHSARVHAGAAVAALMVVSDSKKGRTTTEKKHTAASLNASGVLGFATARSGDLFRAAAIYRDAIHRGLEQGVFHSESTDLGNLEAQLGSVRFAASDVSDDALDENENDVDSTNREDSKSELRLAAAAAAAESAAVESSRTKRLSSIAALEEALGCFGRALEIEQKTNGAFSGRCLELQARVDETIAALFEQRAAGEDGAAFL
jgi:hypothetical protein